MQTDTKIQIPAWHSLELSEVLLKLKSDQERGLTVQEARARQLSFGKNTLPKGKKVTALQMIARQFTSPLVYILLIAGILTGVIGDYADMAVIFVVVAVNAMIGFFQEYRASKIFEKLKSIVRVEALVIRDRKLQSLDSEELVPGDLIVLKGGGKVPADARLITVSNLGANEALLTGESKPVNKAPGAVAAKALVGDRTNMVFMGTVLEEGEGQAVVVATGARTEIGQISLLTQNAIEDPSPLQIRMEKLAGFLTYVFLIIAAGIFIIGLLEGDSWIEMIKTTVAVAVAAIPEGLPAAISIILAVSSKKILEKKGLVMKLVAAETLGSTSVVCADKTGTLTLGQMKVEQLITPSYSPPYNKGEKEGVKEALLAMALANEAVLEEKEGKLVARGESTDKAKLEYFLQSGGDYQKTIQDMPRIGILPFNSDRKYLAAFHEKDKKVKVFVSGAPETMLALCKVSARQKAEAKKIYEDLANRGFRVIALASKSFSSPLRGEGWVGVKPQLLRKHIATLTYLGLAAIRDPIRSDVLPALKLTRAAGVRVLMITGDHALTARAIGLELGFSISANAVITGGEIDVLSEAALRQKIGSIEIIARATPVHKMRVIDAWQKLGAVVAMTGDGVNDAPALKSADIGVAVGSGTDVSKEASDLILLDDSFATMTEAIKEGRTGFANIRKATVVVMSNAFTEIVLITAALLFRVPFFPITAVQILWVNLAEDSLPVLALAFEPTEKGIMNRKPLSPKEPILDRESKFIIFAVGILSDLLLFGMFVYLYKFSGWTVAAIQSFVFVAAATPTLLNVFAFKSLREPITKINIFSNKFLVGSVAIGFALMLTAIYEPHLASFLKTVPLPLWPALVCVLFFPLFKLLLVELTKWWYRNKLTKA